MCIVLPLYGDGEPCRSTAILWESLRGWLLWGEGPLSCLRLELQYSSRRIHTVVERMRAATFYILLRAVVKHYGVSCSGVLCVWR